VALGLPSKKIASVEEVKARMAQPTANVTPIKKTDQELYDPWATPLVEPAADVFDAWHCVHGDRVEIEGEKNGKAYFGMGCPKTRNSGEQCAANWFSLNAEGKWVPKLEAVK
jgi:hypothetical protein